MVNKTRSTYALIARAARMIQNSVDGQRQCHTQNDHWGDDREAQQIYNEEISTVATLRELLQSCQAGLPVIEREDVKCGRRRTSIRLVPAWRRLSSR